MLGQTDYNSSLALNSCLCPVHRSAQGLSRGSSLVFFSMGLTLAMHVALQISLRALELFTALFPRIFLLCLLILGLLGGSAVFSSFIPCLRQQLVADVTQKATPT